MQLEAVKHRPGTVPMLFKAGFTSAKRKKLKHAAPELPARGFRCPFQPSPQHYQQYCRIVNWSPNAQAVHPCYPQLASFALHLKLMLLPEFPFPMMGLVHLANQIQQHAPFSLTGQYMLSAFADNLRRHDKGWCFDLVTEISGQGQKVWVSRATTLYRTSSGAKTKASRGMSLEPALAQQQQWSLPANLGRQYAGISGDYNPIHLFRFTAPLFGFSRPIAHGMWSLARCLSALQGELPTLSTINCQFKRPLAIPATVVFSHQHAGERLSFRLHDRKQQQLHLTGEVTVK